MTQIYKLLEAKLKMKIKQILLAKYHKFNKKKKKKKSKNTP